MPFSKLPKYLTLFLFAFGFHFAAYGQLELAGFRYSHFPSVGIEDSPSNQEVELSEFNFFLNLPKKLKNDKTVLVNGLEYKLVTPSSEDDFDLITGNRQNLHFIGYRLMILHPMANDWRLLLLANPSLSSTFNTDLEGDDFLFNGTLLFTKKKSERFSYGGGLVFTSRFGNPRFLPALQFDFTQPKSELKIILPNRITYERFYGKLTPGLQMTVDGSNYNYNFYRVNEDNELELVSSLGYTRVVVGPTVKYCIRKMIQLEASGGLAVARRLELQGDTFENEQFNVENGAFFQVGISLVPPNKEED